MNFLTIFDFILLPFYLAIIGLIAYFVKKKHIETNPEYTYYIPALFVKISGAIAVCLVYTYYYKDGGDTNGYFLSSRAVGNLLFTNPKAFFSILFNNRTLDLYSCFTRDTGYPWYWNDNNAFSIVRFTTLLIFAGGFKYILTSVLVAWLTFTGVWRIFLIFVSYNSRCTKQFAYAILFVPSVVFWGSGIMKDSYLLAAIGWFLYSVHKLTQVRKIKYFAFLLISFYIIMSIKPLIFYTMCIGLTVWGLFSLMSKIQNTIIRIISYPVVVIGVASLGLMAFKFSSSMASGYYGSVDAMLNRAVIIQDDLTRDYYGENSFNIGKFDPTIQGIASKFPVATVAGLFRPFIWEARTAMMFISGFENLVFLAFTLFVIFRVGPFFFVRSMTSSPYIIIYSLMFAIFFAFSVGLVTANFGALVRYKIPTVPFYLSSLILIYDKYRNR